MKTTRWALLFALLGTAANGAEVYLSKDANGVTTYTDRPNTSGNSETVHVATPRAGRPGNTVAARPAAQPDAQPGAAQAAAAPGQQPPAQPTAVPPSPTEVKANRQKNCETARERASKFTVAQRIYRESANGEREYLTDEQIDEAKAKAATDVATWCN